MKWMKSADCPADQVMNNGDPNIGDMDDTNRLLQVETAFLDEVLRDGWDDTSIQDLMASLGEAMDVDRVYRYQITAELDRGIVVQGWSAPDVTGRFEENQHQLSQIGMLVNVLDNNGLLTSDQLESG